jgi:hypothetical protein
VILASDNDGDDNYVDVSIRKMAENLQKRGIPVTVLMPRLPCGKDKIDWNDILIHQGLEQLQKQLKFDPIATFD